MMTKKKENLIAGRTEDSSGRNLLPDLRGKYQVEAPRRHHLYDPDKDNLSQY